MIDKLVVLSDFSYRTAFTFYVLGMLASLVYYASFRGRRIVPSVATSVGVSGSTVGDTVLVESTSAHDTDYADPGVSGDRWSRFTRWFVSLGLLFHVGSLVFRGIGVGRVPWGNLFEYASLTSAIGILVALLVIRRPAYSALWPFVLVPVIALMFLGATKFYAEAAPVVPALKSYWLPIHVSVVSLGCGVLFLSGVCSVVYLLKFWGSGGRLGGGVAKVAAPLPSVDTLDRLSYQLAIIGFPIFGIGLICGAIWAETAWGRFWGWDPKETTSFVAWVLYAGYLHARATSGWGPQKAAWVNIAGFAVFVFNLFFVNMVVSGLHSYAGV